MKAGGIASPFRISGPSISRQLSILKVADLVTARREANRIHYAPGVIPYRAGDPHLR